MKPLLLILLLVLLSSLCFGYRDSHVMGIEPSAVTMSMGLGTGVVNVWTDSPLLSKDNPALTALREGISYGARSSVYRESIKVHYATGVMNLGYSGVGITLPFYNPYRGTGTINRDDLDYFHEIDNEENHQFGIAYNPLYSLKKHSAPGSLISHLDAALGMNLNFYNHHIRFGYDDSKGYACFMDLGGVVRASYNPTSYINLQGVIGTTATNIFNPTIRTTENNTSYDGYRLKEDMNYGAALSASLLCRDIIPSDMPPAFLFSGNLLSARVLSSYNSETNHRPAVIHGSAFRRHTYKTGMELGLLDTVFFRAGDGRYGYGIDLHYKDLVSYSYNYASAPYDDYLPRHRYHENNVRLNLMALINLLRR